MWPNDLDMVIGFVYNLFHQVYKAAILRTKKHLALVFRLVLVMALFGFEDPNGDGTPDDLSGLAEIWDKDTEIRHGAIQRKSLLAWTSPKHCGRINYDSLQLNVRLMGTIVAFWCPRQPKPKTMALDNIKWQVGFLHQPNLSCLNV